MAVKVTQLLEYVAIRALTAIAQSLPFSAAARFARCVADLTWVIDLHHRKIAASNLNLAYDNSLSPSEVRWVTRGVYRHLFTCAVEMLFMSRRLRGDNWKRFIRIRNLEYLEKALAYNRGVVFATGHFGNWEVMGAALSGQWVPIASVARPLANPLLNNYVRKVREGFGQKIVEKRGALRKLARVLQNGEGVAFLVDQNDRHADIFVDFFGRKAAATSAFAAFALRFECPVVNVFCRRVGDFEFEVIFADPIIPDPSQPREEEILRITRECNDRLEEVIRKDPDQWLWLHRRWRTRPPEESSVTEGAFA